MCPRVGPAHAWGPESPHSWRTIRWPGHADRVARESRIDLQGRRARRRPRSRPPPRCGMRRCARPDRGRSGWRKRHRATKAWWKAAGPARPRQGFREPPARLRPRRARPRRAATRGAAPGATPGAVVVDPSCPGHGDRRWRSWSSSRSRLCRSSAAASSFFVGGEILSSSWRYSTRSSTIERPGVWGKEAGHEDRAATPARWGRRSPPVSGQARRILDVGGMT
jgi:hypothetical protein